jgi:cellulose synthase/poly-beta-1,6-N-acetylglucosamine synthase-like glycosyltransferase
LGESVVRTDQLTDSRSSVERPVSTHVNERVNGSSGTPTLSLIIAVRNDWWSLEGCLKSLAAQLNPPSFELIVVNDGSDGPIPESVQRDLAVHGAQVLHQPPSGVSAARNRGLKASKGSTLVFIDADTKLDALCLNSLCKVLSEHTARHYFQLRLVGDRSVLVGRAEELRLAALQRHLTLADGSIRYLNTAGFAVRRSSVDVENGLFDPSAVRAEDTLLLLNLMQGGELPFFVSTAIVQHAIPLTLLQCLRKDMRSVRLEKETYRIAAARGVRVRLTHRERLKMLVSMWRDSRRQSLGRMAWLVVVIRQALQRTISTVDQFRDRLQGHFNKRGSR